MSNNKYVSWVVFFAAIIFIVMPWFSIQSQYLVNGNISWLLMAAERLLNGQSLSQHIYEPNPPLSILVYIPHVLFAKALGLLLPVGSFYLTSIFVMISVLVVSLIIKKFEFLSSSEKKAFILGYIVSITLITTLFFSEREHFIIITLIPFILCQYALTNRINIHKALLVPVIIIGAVFILIKPHYGIIPAALLIHRMIKQKRFNIFFDIDFIALTTASLIYVAIIFVFFNDYINVILPDVLTLYITSKQPDTALESIKIHIIINISLFFFELFREDLSKNKKGLLLLLYSSALLSFIPYFVQMKGFYNHIIPIYAFFICAVTLSVSFRVSKYLKNYKILHFIIPLIAVILISSIISPLNKNYPKQTDIPNLPLGKFLSKECSPPCSFLIFHGDMEIFNPTAAYMDYEHGSRFPSLWFLPKMLETKDNKNLINKYTQMVLQDLEYYKPSIMLIAIDLPIINVGKFNFVYFFGQDKNIKYIFDNEYEKGGILEFDRGEYFKGTTMEESHILKYDIYRRKK